MSEFQQKQVQSFTWKDLLEGKVRNITPQVVDFMLSHKPDYDLQFEELTPISIKVKEPVALAISGTGGVVGALYLLHLYPDSVKYIITTPEVLTAEQNSPLYIARYAIERIKEKYPWLQVIELYPGDYQKLKNILAQGGIYVSGLPTELVIQIAQVAGFGKLYHHSPIQKKMFIY